MMAGMITLIITGLLRVLRTRRALVLEYLALRHQLAVLQRAAPTPATRRPTVLGPLVPNVERLGACPLLGQTRDCHPVASDRLHAVLDLEEPTNRSRPPGPLP